MENNFGKGVNESEDLVEDGTIGGKEMSFCIKCGRELKEGEKSNESKYVCTGK